MNDTQKSGTKQARCWSCQAFLSDDAQDEEGYYCPNCLDEPHAAELEANGWEYDGERWVRADTKHGGGSS